MSGIRFNNGESGTETSGSQPSVHVDDDFLDEVDLMIQVIEKRKQLLEKKLKRKQLSQLPQSVKEILTPQVVQDLQQKAGQLKDVMERVDSAFSQLQSLQYETQARIIRGQKENNVLLSVGKKDEVLSAVKGEIKPEMVEKMVEAAQCLTSQAREPMVQVLQMLAESEKMLSSQT